MEHKNNLKSSLRSTYVPNYKNIDPTVQVEID